VFLKNDCKGNKIFQFFKLHGIFFRANAFKF
jgi:hypothetical protein